MVQFYLFALAFLHAQGAFAAAISAIVRCGTEEPPYELLAQAEAFRSTSHLRPQAFGGSISVNTYFHVVTSAGKNGSVTSSQLSSQVQPLAYHLARDLNTPVLISFSNYQRRITCVSTCTGFANTATAQCAQQELQPIWNQLQPSQLRLHGEQ